MRKQFKTASFFKPIAFMIDRLKSSLSSKLIITFIIASVILAGVLWVSLGITFEKHFSNNISPYLYRYLTRINREIGFPPNFEVAKKIADKLSVKIVLETPNNRWSSDGDFLDLSHLSMPIKQVYTDGSSVAFGRYKGLFILRSYQFPYITTLILKDNVNTGFSVKELLIVFLSVLCIVVALYWFISYLFAPIRQIERRVKLIGNGDFTQRLDINRADEIGSLSQSINKMADNLEQILEAKRQLLLAISHELRTPITRSKIALSLLEDSYSKESIEEDLTEMEQLIHELLETERLKGKHVPLDLEQCNINELVCQVTGRFFAEDQLNLDLQTDIADLTIDAKRIGLVIKNLIKNAITSQQDSSDSPVRVETRVVNDLLKIIVYDHGVGIDPEDIDKITEPFYRTDSSRQRKTGGYGIGLYLIKLIVEAHDGTLLIESEKGLGTTVTVTLKMNELVDKLS